MAKEKVDEQGRIHIQQYFLEVSGLKGVKSILFIEEEERKYRIIPKDNVPEGTKISLPPHSFDKKGRLIIPSYLRKLYLLSQVDVYVQDSKLYIEF